MTRKSILTLGLLTAGLAASALHAANPAPQLGKEPVFLRDVEVIQKPDILFIDRVVNGRIYGMDGEVTIRMLKLANGQLLYSPQWLSAEARELNVRICESNGQLPPIMERAIIVFGEMAIPGQCSLNESDLKRLEEQRGRPLSRNDASQSEVTVNIPEPLFSYPCDVQVASDVPWSVSAGENFSYTLNYSISMPGDSMGTYAVGGGVSGACGVNDNGQLPAGYEFSQAMYTLCNISRPGVRIGGADGAVNGTSDSCYDSHTFSVWAY